MYNTEKNYKNLKVIISEAIMVIAVIITVIVLAFIVSGYWVNSDFKIERQGLLQISSIPTGADIDIDGESPWLQKTNTSKVLSSGEHTVTLTKDGYDSWSKTVNIFEGLLYRIHYPRLFLQDRVSEKVFDVTETSLATISPKRNLLLLINQTTKWNLINLEDSTLESQEIDISKYFSSVSLAENANIGVFTGKILDMDWDRDNSHILFKVNNEDDIEWVLLDVKNPKNSINLTKEFTAEFSSVKILDNSSNNLLVLQGHNLHKIDVPRKTISAVLVSGINSYDHYNDEIVFSAEDSTSEADAYYIGLLNVNENEISRLESSSEPVKVLISRFYDDDYITIITENNVTLYKEESFEKVSEFELSFTPNFTEVGHNGEFIIMYSGNQIATLDMEAMKVNEWETDGDIFGWIDNDMIYSVADGKLIVYDFDGLNRRVLTKNTSSHFPVAITNDKWLYYFSDDNLIREWLIPR